MQVENFSPSDCRKTLRFLFAKKSFPGIYCFSDN